MARLSSVLACGMLALTAPAFAQDFPIRPVTFVVGYAPGGTSDLVARTVGDDVMSRILYGGRVSFEVAAAVQFLLDDRSGYITGSVLAINGGLEM